ncbi:type II toxin-antitoxin system HicA family toxin [Granulicella paludicola]|uniref:type II toxin-antitoxin system HicA family toxin n=1 Tax=Granulicella paludicola TaxID=474951 RepID=UPI0021DF5133|nr:type II toxin-antitoxin system HicA family toxin [Granulicella paludicola]
MPPKFRDIVRRLEEDGWLLKTQKGSHRQYVHATKPGKVTLAGHPSKDADDGTYKSILRQAGLKP